MNILAGMEQEKLENFAIAVGAVGSTIFGLLGIFTAQHYYRLKFSKDISIDDLVGSSSLSGRCYCVSGKIRSANCFSVTLTQSQLSNSEYKQVVYSKLTSEKFNQLGFRIRSESKTIKVKTN